jgi:hypothetical protein
MRRIRKITAITAVMLIATGSTVAYADDGGDTPTTETTTAPEPTVTVITQDVPADTTPATQAPDTEAPKATDPPATEAPKEEPTTTEAPAPAPTDTQVSPDTEAPSTDAPDTVDPPSTVTASTDVAVTTPHNPVQTSGDQQTVVTGTQVANADTGNNASNSSSDQPATGGGQQPNAIGSGDATAVGSDDTNTVNQQAQVALTDQAIANLVQVALILNIGAALANSGINDATSTPGGNGISGAIDSGNATAIGNDMQQYITQAARANGDANTDDAAKQLAISLWMGLANANSGVNSVTGTGTAGSGGAIGSGDASATGNKSLTDILQQAALNGSGTSQLNVQQYATVMNIGFALANSGVNDIAGVAGQLLSAGDNQQQNDLATNLFSMLLPALLQSFTGSGGSGTIGTGNATAVGNQSQTYVHQLAQAAASGDGIASIIQDVLVANVGAAGANTGGNTLGGSFASLDPDQAKAVVTLAAFLSQMLALVHTQSAETALAMQQQGLDIPFGDIVLQVQGQLQGYDTTLTGATGQQATIHQITIILSLGIAQANSGLNTATGTGINSQSALAASVNGAFTGTGDAAARNGGMVIICQRRNADDIQCLEPPTTTTPPPDQPPDTTVPDTPLNTVPDEPTTTTVWTTLQPHGGGGGPHGLSNPNGTSAHGSVDPLPSTGSNVADILLYAGVFLGLGVVATVVSSRRKYKPRHLRPRVVVTGDD